MADLSGIFKAYDIRGKVGEELNPEVVGAIGKAFADWLPNKGRWLSAAIYGLTRQNWPKL